MDLSVNDRGSYDGREVKWRGGGKPCPGQGQGAAALSQELQGRNQIMTGSPAPWLPFPGTVYFPLHSCSATQAHQQKCKAEPTHLQLSATCSEEIETFFFTPDPEEASGDAGNSSRSQKEFFKLSHFPA